MAYNLPTGVLNPEDAFLFSEAMQTSDYAERRAPEALPTIEDTLAFGHDLELIVYNASSDAASPPTPEETAAPSPVNAHPDFGQSTDAITHVITGEPLHIPAVVYHYNGTAFIPFTESASPDASKDEEEGNHDSLLLPFALLQEPPEDNELSTSEVITLPVATEAAPEPDEAAPLANTEDAKDAGSHFDILEIADGDEPLPEKETETSRDIPGTIPQTPETAFQGHKSDESTLAGRDTDTFIFGLGDGADYVVLDEDSDRIRISGYTADDLTISALGGPFYAVTFDAQGLGIPGDAITVKTLSGTLAVSDFDFIQEPL